MDNSVKNVGVRIRQKRTAAGLKVEELAQKAGVSKAYISQLENGTSTKPSASKLYDIAAVLDTTIADLLGRRIPKQDKADGMEMPKNLIATSKKFNIDDSTLQRMAMVQNREGDSLNNVSEDKWAQLFLVLKQIDNETGS